MSSSYSTVWQIHFLCAPKKFRVDQRRAATSPSLPRFCYTFFIPLFHVLFYTLGCIFHYPMFLLHTVYSIIPVFFTPSIFHYSGFFYKLYTVYSIFPCFVTPCKFHCSMSFYTLYIPLFKFLLNPVCAIIPCFWNTFIFVILPFC